MNSSVVFSHATKTCEAIICLRDAGHHVSAVMLTYAAIDQMSWLAIPGNESCSKDFKEWVNKYILSKENLDCSADDLWAARNGLLHMGVAESRDFEKGKGAVKKIYYTDGSVRITDNRKPDVIFLNIETLISAYLAGVLWFMQDIEGDQKQLAIALKKINKTFKYHDLESHD